MRSFALTLTLCLSWVTMPIAWATEQVPEVDAPETQGGWVWKKPLAPNASAPLTPWQGDAPADQGIAGDNQRVGQETATTVTPAKAGLRTQTHALFEVHLIERHGAEPSAAAEPWQAKLKRALKIELQRLTGHTQASQGEQAQFFLQTPQKWLANYRQAPFMQEGVQVGQRWVFEFDADKFYQAFRQNDWVLWPLKARPTTLVLGTHNRGGQKIKLDQNTLQYIPQLQWDHLVGQWALPVYWPEQAPNLTPDSDASALWLRPQSAQSDSMVAKERLAQTGLDHLLTYEWVQVPNQPSKLVWQLFDRQGQALMFQQIQAPSQASRPLQSMINRMFGQVSAFYSKPFRADADFIGSVQLTLNKVFTFQQVQALEAMFEQQKPQIEQVRLLKTWPQAVQFELVYQGNFEALLQTLNALSAIEVRQASAHTSQIVAQWRHDWRMQDMDWPQVVFGFFNQPDSVWATTPVKGVASMVPKQMSALTHAPDGPKQADPSASTNAPALDEQPSGGVDYIEESL